MAKSTKCSVRNCKDKAVRAYSCAKAGKTKRFCKIHYKAFDIKFNSDTCPLCKTKW